MFFPKILTSHPVRVAQLAEVCPVQQEIAGSILSQGAYGRQSLSLSLFPLSSLSKKNKHPQMTIPLVCPGYKTLKYSWVHTVQKYAVLYYN